MRSTIAFGVGALVGAGFAIFYAPRIGDRIQRGFEQVTRSIGRGQAKVHDAAGEAMRVADQAKDQVQRVQDAVDAGVRAFKEVKTKLA